MSRRQATRTPVHSARDEDLRLGALLRLAYHAVAEQMAAWLVASGYTELQPSHSAAIQSLWAHPEGRRLTAMAETAHVTKQTMGALVDQLEHHGYVERVPDPDDGRASRVRLTKRGEAFGRKARDFSQRLESELEALLGAEKLDDLRASLRAIHDTYRATA